MDDETVRFHAAARAELLALPERDRESMYRVIAKLRVMRTTLGAPHQSAVLGAQSLRELRPRAGRSRWRALYRRIGDVFFIVAIAPEAQIDPLGFRRAVRLAKVRLGEIGAAGS